MGSSPSPSDWSQVKNLCHSTVLSFFGEQWVHPWALFVLTKSGLQGVSHTVPRFMLSAAALQRSNSSDAAAMFHLQRTKAECRFSWTNGMLLHPVHSYVHVAIASSLTPHVSCFPGALSIPVPPGNMGPSDSSSINHDIYTTCCVNTALQLHFPWVFLLSKMLSIECFHKANPKGAQVWLKQMCL